MTANVSQRLDPQVRRGPEAGPQGARNPPQVLVLALARRLPHPVASVIRPLIAGCPNARVGEVSRPQGV